MEQVRVRFAPSPTGYLHIGGARTALFNWFFAKQQKGKLVLRIEDTDEERLKEDSVSQILASLKWLGIDWDEGPEKEGNVGPYYQSQRKNIYRAIAAQLVEAGKAYYCFCSEAELEAERGEQRKKGAILGYSGKCRQLSEDEVNEKINQGLKYVIRFKLPQNDYVEVHDLIRGTVKFRLDQMDDFIIMKSNGLPAYNFACTVDDHAMKISHVIRAEEHLPNTPKQWLLYEALGYEIPQFAHLSMILAPDRSKLSKRHGATSVGEFKAMGCLPEAIINYLTLLGYSPSLGGTQSEVFTPEQIVGEFELAKVAKTAAVYDVQKLVWLNGQYISSYDLNQLTEAALPFFVEEGILTAEEGRVNSAYFQKVVELIRSRVKTLNELAEAGRYFFEDVKTYDEKGIKKYFSTEEVGELLSQGRKLLAEVELFREEDIEEAYRQLAEAQGIKSGVLIHPTRLALTGRTVSPGLFEVMALLGREKCLSRLDQAIKFINSNKNL